jgi:hypothetical protein
MPCQYYTINMRSVPEINDLRRDLGGLQTSTYLSVIKLEVAIEATSTIKELFGYTKRIHIINVPGST